MAKSKSSKRKKKKKMEPDYIGVSDRICPEKEKAVDEILKRLEEKELQAEASKRSVTFKIAGV